MATRDEIAPYVKKDDGYYIQVGDFNPGVPEYGPYRTIDEMNEERNGIVERIKEWIKAGRPPTPKVNLWSKFGLRSEDCKRG